MVLTKAAHFSVRPLAGRPLRFPNLPCINVGPSSSKPVFIPPEMCETVAGQRRTKLTPMQTREIIKLAAQRPMVRAKGMSLW